MFEFVRPAGSFSPELRRLWIDTFSQAYKDVHSHEDIQAYCNKHFTLQAANAVFLDVQTVCEVAQREQEAVGFFILVHKPCPVDLQGESSELKQVYVLESEYGSGLGKALVLNAMEEVAVSGKQWLWLCVSDLNVRAQTFYRKLGFVTMGKGPEIEVGRNRFSSSYLALKL